ncbi:MAG TPA: beta-galactosidase [Phycisphaerae bacterium]|nr:beta-galactosidase [Phycisphaerae bacterium]
MKRHLFAAVVAAFAVQAARAELTSEVKPLNGVPALYVNGKLTSQVFAAPYRSGNPGRGGAAANVDDFKDFSAAGITGYDIYLRFPWTGPETYDFSGVDSKMDALLAANPKAMFIPRVLLTPGRWFVEQYPDEISRRDDGSPAGMFSSQNAGNNPSFSSTVYRDLSKKCMTAFIHHVEEKYGDHILGYQVGNGFGGEWLPFNSFWEQDPPPAQFGVEDYSPAALKGFRGWLRAKYRTDGTLQAAWHDPKVTLETATIPNEKDRYTTTDGIFFDPAGPGGTRCPDWFTYYNDSVASVLVENAAWAKELTGRKKIVGSFYGYLWCNFPNLSAVHSGQLGLTKVLNSPDVDFLCSPYTYDNKALGGPNNSQSLPNAAALHGKLYFNEVDTETHLQHRQWRWGNSLNNPMTFDETKALLTRDYAYSLTNGNGMWWTDLQGRDYHDDQIIALLKQFQEIDGKYLNSRPGSNAEICCVLDESAFTYTGDGEPLWNALLTAQKQWEFGFIGAPWDCHLLNDIGNPSMRDYKFYIFLNTFHVTPQQREAVHAKLKKNHATALWVYAPGYIGETSSSIDNMTALTGIKFGKDMTPGELHIDGTGHAFAAPGIPYGTDVKVTEITRYYDHQLYLKDPRDTTLKRDLPGFRISPRFYVDDPETVSLGELAGIQKRGLVTKPQDGWNSIYSAAPLVPAAILRDLAGAAGCAIYSDGNDNVYANENFLAIYSPKGGDRTIKLPRKSDVLDLLTGRQVGAGITEFPVKLQVNESVLYRLDLK